ncbi:MAG: hypothetical protein K8R23_13925 [Chthoniobacter sp.]|nr:hypothetical protein [Chthoniobacter sp.]
MKSTFLYITLAGLAAAPMFAGDVTPTASPRRIEIESKFIELPEAVADALKLPTGGSFMDQFPGKPLPTTRPHLTAVLDDKDAEQFLATLNAQKSVDLCSAPRVASLSQQRAVVDIIREFRYASEWNPPNENEKRWTPKTFETRNVGMSLEVTPTFTKDGLIELKATPSIVEFLGFVDFETGKSFFAAKADLTETPVDRTLKSVLGFEPPNRPTRPIFSTRKADVELAIYPGQTVVLSGFGERESIQPFTPVRPGYQIIVLIRATPSPPFEKPTKE